MEYQKDYFGFVYQWTDKKRNMYYIGSHHGPMDDGYVGSNTRFLRAYHARPTDFVREIISINRANDHKQTLQLEQIALDQVSNIKDHPQYYNKKNEANGGWSFIGPEHIEKRASSLVKRQSKNGLSDKERASYKQKIKTRLDRIRRTGFTEKEKAQHRSYGYLCEVRSPLGETFTYSSLAEASRETGIDCAYARTVTLQGRTYKGYSVRILQEPIIDCRSFKE